MEGHEWQAQRIVGERQTPSGLEYEVSFEKTLWLPKATLDTKLVRRYRAEQRAATRVRTRWSSRLQKAGSSVVVDSGLVEGGLYESESLFAGSGSYPISLHRLNSSSNR